jgi:hypothetical protein
MRHGVARKNNHWIDIITLEPARFRSVSGSRIGVGIDRCRLFFEFYMEKFMTPQRVAFDQLPGPRFFGGWTPLSDPQVIYSLSRQDHQLFFCNHSPFCLDQVSYTSVGSASGDSPEDPVIVTKPFDINYLQVEPKQAVLVDEFDDDWDGDFLIMSGIEVSIGDQIESFMTAEKGGPLTEVLKYKD